MVNDVITVSAAQQQQQQTPFGHRFQSERVISPEEELMIMRASQSKSDAPVDVIRSGAGEKARMIRSGRRIPEECKSKCDLSRCKRTMAR